MIPKIQHPGTFRTAMKPKRYFKEEGEVECHDMNGSAKRRHNRSLRTFWRHEHLLMKMVVAITTHLSSRPRRWLSLGKKARDLDCLVRDVASKTWWQWYLDAAECVFYTQPVTHSKMRILKSVNGLVTDRKRDPGVNNRTVEIQQKREARQLRSETITPSLYQ